MIVPLVSVVIPTRNRAAYILDAIESVFSQTYANHEIIVVDDGSTDATKELLAPLLNAGRVRYFFQDGKGVSSARNRGVKEARGELIAFLDSDDLFLPTKLEKQVELLRANPDFAFIHCNFSKFDDAGNELGERDTSKFQGTVYPELLQEWSILMAMPCILLRKATFENAGGFDKEMTWAEDLDLWRRLARLGPVGTVPETLVRVRVHPASASFSKRGSLKGFERYLEKAFAEDPALDIVFKRRATAGMYTKLAQNLLGEGDTSDMRQVREYSIRALRVRGFQINALGTWLASLLPSAVRRVLASGIRRVRYRTSDAPI